MKKILATLVFTCAMFSYSYAQNNSASGSASEELDPVTWKAAQEHADDKDYLVVTANIDKGWHIFTNDPGGDGFAIPTSLQLVSGTDTVKITDRMASMKPIQHNFEGMGLMNFFEGKVVYKMLMPEDRKKTWRLYITYQCCNDKMCLPPADIEMDIK
jgi:hypothetical protein